MNYMELAFKEALKSYKLNEIPVGCVIVKDDVVIGRGHNTLIQENHVITHAETNAIREAAQTLNTWNLQGCIMYVTLEPCMMCAGALVLSRLDKVVIGAKSDKGGFLLSNYDLSKATGVNHTPEIILANHVESSDILKTYFKEKRMNKIIFQVVENHFQLEQCLKIRERVFVEEQHVSIEEEIDEHDTLADDTIHLLAIKGGSPVGTLRILPKGKGIYKVGRVAVLKENRKDKIGFLMIQDAENKIRNLGGKEIQLEAQLHAIPFYQKCGFKEEGEIFLDANIEHKLMRKPIKN